MQQQSQGQFHFGSREGLPDEALAALAQALGKTPDRSQIPLEGRGGAQALEIPAIGRVFIKHYLRGGLLGKIIERDHLWSPKSRSQHEFEALHALRQVGVATPEPVAWAETKGLWVRCWLIMREAAGVRPYTSIIQESPETAEQLMPPIIDQVRLLLRERCHHVDFHPGNILINAQNEVLLIDFDKSRRRDESTEVLASRYVERWQRAVVKHGLPAWVAERFRTLLLESPSSTA